MAVTDSGGTKMHLYTYDKIYQVTEVNYPAGYEYLVTTNSGDTILNSMGFWDSWDTILNSY